MVRLFYPEGANPKPFPALLPLIQSTSASSTCGSTTPSCSPPASRSSSGCGFCSNRTKLGLAIRAVAQDEETARTMGINFTAIVLITFAIGSALAAIGGVMNGLY